MSVGIKNTTFRMKFSCNFFLLHSEYVPNISKMRPGITATIQLPKSRIKGSFYSESAICFSNPKKNIPNYYPELEI